ncbi:MAG: hypothetical protein E7325_07295 [Clostridiales bacterium]|nr:hypothetical protein [Clostridiales bacterium]
MKRGALLLVLSTMMVCLICSAACASGWTVPNNHSSGSGNYSSDYGITVQLIEDLATRSGPSTGYTGCGTYRMNGQYVTALSRAYDSGSVLWIEVEFSYNGGYRRAWTGAKRLDLSASQLRMLPEENSMSFIGYGTVNSRVAPRFGPDSIFATYGDRDYYQGDRVAVITEENNYYLVESYHTDGKILRSWIPCEKVYFDK